jgi:hypothetical protein
LVQAGDLGVGFAVIATTEQSRTPHSSTRTILPRPRCTKSIENKKKENMANCTKNVPSEFVHSFAPGHKTNSPR